MKQFKTQTHHLILCLLILSGFSLKAQDEGKVIDKVIAIVGGEVLLQSTLETQFASIRAQGNIVDEATKCEIAEEMLFQKLLVHQASVDSVVVADEEVEGEINRRLSYFIAQIGSEKKLEQYYKKSMAEIKDEFRIVVKEQMIAQRMQGRITSNISITPKEVKAFYNRIPEDSIPQIESEVEYAQLVFYAKESNEEKEAARARIEAIRDRIIKGEDFATLAILYSEDEGSAKKGGEIGFMGRAELVSAYSAVAFKLKNTAVSEIVQSEFGFHIIQLIERRGQKANTRHILIKIKTSDKEVQKAKNLADSIYSVIPTDTITFGDYALKYSNDEKSNKSNGMVANPATGTTTFNIDEVDPQVFYTLDKLNPGEISKPVPAQSLDGKKGYRIIKLISKTEPHKASLENDYSKIQNAALSGKENQETLKWIKEKLKSTYVSISDDYNKCNFENPWVKTL